MSYNLTADEEATTLDNWHPLECDCPDCRPDMHEIEAAEASRKESA